MAARPIVVLRCALGMVAVCATAWAQDPKFEYGKAEEVKDPNAVEWKASAQAGLIVSTGNSQAASLSAGAIASRKAGNNKFSLDAAAAYARSEVRIAADGNMNGTIEENEVTEQSTTSTKNWLIKLRYDRFFTAHDSAFLSGRIGADEPAGKKIYGGAQIGYSRLLYKTAMHELVAEIGYDFTYEDYENEAAEALSIHSGRLFAGYSGKLSEVTGVAASIEALFNLNTEDTLPDETGAFEDTRLVMKASLTTKLVKRIDFRFAVTGKYDTEPAPLPPFALPYAANFSPRAEKLDVITEAALIVSFL